MNSRARYVQLGVPAAVLGVLASAISAAPASAAAPAERGAEGRLAALPRVLPTAAAPATYTVQEGDTVFSIAQRFGLRTVDVLTWNGLGWRSVIYPGQTLALAAPAPAPAAPAPSAPAPAAATHTVVAGDTIFAIAQKHGTSVDSILAANGLSRDSVIYPGQSIAISGTSAVAAAPAVTPTPAAPAPAPSSGTAHTVVAGDTIFAIAQKHGTSVDAIYTANGLSASSIIYPGQTIVVAAAAPAPAASAPAASAPAPAQTAALNAPQAENAAMIIRIGRELGVSDRGIAIALATSMVESWLRNLDWGDRDSLGLFQQRPSTGWGTADQIMDRDRSIRVFYGGAHDPNGTTTRGLLDVAGWEGMAFKDAAQAVQISAYPDRYGQWEAQAYEWIALYG
ncbi:LysM peptidoglycan-binding domain-containing protein [Microbacterium sp.]|uniref:LysM peptidoglycan-binding domain-containing protein n=1 Tax=Microbacterium sp. TaxID=51671 RepID=UPI0027358A89|nr:LysM peptidoglycan-binding domain-containing protein [Microbacterium sp.]MDP3951107.1 LysM peptidoglycan-binding domain-containing protein [Microbacterium sp.]